MHYIYYIKCKYHYTNKYLLRVILDAVNQLSILFHFLKQQVIISFINLTCTLTTGIINPLTSSGVFPKTSI